MGDIKYNKMMDESFNAVFGLFCRIRKVSSEQSEKLKSICKQFFELGALSFADDDKFPYTVALCEKCGYPIFHGEARTATSDDQNYHVKCDKVN